MRTPPHPANEQAEGSSDLHIPELKLVIRFAWLPVPLNHYRTWTRLEFACLVVWIST